MSIQSLIPRRIFQVGVASAKPATRLIARYVAHHPDATIAFQGEYQTLPSYLRRIVPSSRWTKVYPARYYYDPKSHGGPAAMKAAGEKLGKDIYQALRRAKDAPGFVLIDELRLGNALVIKSAAQYLAKQQPSVAGRWGTYFAHVDSYRPYDQDGVLAALKSAGARAVVEEYPQRLMIDDPSAFKSYVNVPGLKFLKKRGLDPTVVLGVYDSRIGDGAAGTQNLQRLMDKFEQLAPGMRHRLGAWQFGNADPDMVARAKIVTLAGR